VADVGDASALTCASAWVTAPTARVRALGFELLGFLALDHVPAQHALLEAAATGVIDRSVRVREAVAFNIGMSVAKRAGPLLLQLATDRHPWVRTAAVGALPLSVYQPEADHPVVRALVAATRDEDLVVRDWAAFSLGTQLDVDSPEVRQALQRLVGQIEEDTPKHYPGAEALLGLAVRGDPTALPVVRRRLLDPGVSTMAFAAAEALADRALLPALLAHRGQDNEPDDPWVVRLEAAIAACAASTRGPA